MHRLLLLLAFLLAACGGSTTNPARDAGTPRPDGSSDRTDSGGTPGVDGGGTPGIDGGGEPRVDGGGEPPRVDGGGEPPRIDGGDPPRVDGGGGEPSGLDAGPTPGCGDSNVLCVDDTPGPTQEFATIQAAVEVAGAGDVVLVHPGNYVGAEITTSGTAGSPLTLRAIEGAVIDRDGPTSEGIRLTNVSHVRVLGFRIVGSTIRCIAARGATATAPMSNLTIAGNRCEGAGQEGFYLSQISSSLVEGNFITGSGAGGGGRAHGMYLANAGSDNTTLRGNTITMAGASESNGIHFNGDLSIGGDGMISGLLVEGNVIYGHGQNGLNLDGVEASTFRNNVIFANVRHALRAYQIDAAEGPRALVIVNNTLVAMGSGAAVRLTEERGGHVIFNNILYTDPGGESISLEDPGASMIGPNATTDGAGAVSATPALFVNFGGRDFHLAAGSAAIDRGQASFAGITAPAFDADGASRPARAGFDLGAYEAR